MLSQVIITGSLAYDHIMVFNDRFKNHILPEKTHVLSVSFQVDSLSRHFGGTAGNVAYNLALLGQKALILGVAGKDFQDYADRLMKLGLSTEYIRIFPNEFTAQAFITTDLDDNQITAFHPGAMKRAHEQRLSVVREPIDLALIGPNQVQAMVSHAKHCRRDNISFWFDPGQSLTEISGDELVSAFTGASGIVVNDYEWEMLRSKSGLTEQQVLQRVKVVLVTMGEKGVDILSCEDSAKVIERNPLHLRITSKARDSSAPRLRRLGRNDTMRTFSESSIAIQRQHIAAVPNIHVIDPTGAGDAFRAGLFYGLVNRQSLVDSCRFACAVASFAVEKEGTQNHQLTLKQVEQRKNLCL